MINMKVLMNALCCRVTTLQRFHRGYSTKPDCIIGKVALVTGAARGLGRACSEILLKNGAKVYVTDSNASGGQGMVSQLSAKYGKDKVMFQNCDVRNLTQMKKAFQNVKDKMGGLDIVINNAATAGEKRDMWETTVDVNLKGTIRGTLLGIQHMRIDKGGSGGVIVNVASMAGINPSPCGPVYSATKSGIIMFSQCWSKNPEIISNGIRINILAPAVNTALLKVLSDTSISYVPEGGPEISTGPGVMSPKEIAEELLALVCDKGKNGAILKVGRSSGVVYQIM